MPRRKTAPQPLPNPDDPNSVLVPLTRGMFAIVDRIDVERVSQFLWSATTIRGRWYSVGRVVNEEGWSKLMLMHRFIVNPPDSAIVDHKNGNALDNRRSNLRLATKAENAMNSRLRSDNTSGYRGVTYDARRKSRPWRAFIRDGGQRWLGYYETAEEAARAYDAAAKVSFGEFARPNFSE